MAELKPDGNGLERARIRAIYLVLAMIAAGGFGSFAGLVSLDLGVFATLMGGLLALLGLGSVVKLIGTK